MTRKRLGEVGNPTELGVHPGSEDRRLARPGRNRRSGEQDIAALQEIFLKRGIGITTPGQGLACAHDVLQPASQMH